MMYYYSMNIFDIRRENLLMLLKDARSQKEFSIDYGLNPTHLSQMKLGQREMGEIVARKLEKALGVPNLWFDLRHTDDHLEVTPSNANDVASGKARPLSRKLKFAMNYLLNPPKGMEHVAEKLIELINALPDDELFEDFDHKSDRKPKAIK